MRLFEENNKNIKLELKEVKEENGIITGVYVKIQIILFRGDEVCQEY